VEVAILDRGSVGSGASWGNAGIISPALTVPLPEPSILRFGLRAILDPGSPVALRMPPSRRTLLFLAKMARHCTSIRWKRAMDVYRALNDQIFEAFDQQQAGGIGTLTTTTDFLIAFRHPGEALGILSELSAVAAAGQEVALDVLTGSQARRLEPHLSPAISTAILLRGQRYLTPSTYVSALAEQVRLRGGRIYEQTAVGSVARHGDRVVVSSSQGSLEADAVVLATGSWLSSLARPHGVRLPVHAGRGYSFTVRCQEPLRGPLYLPSTRVAFTPDRERARLAGIMEFAEADAQPSRGRIPSMVRAVGALVEGFDLDERANEWVGARPLTPDGIPVVGSTRTPGVFVAGGHGMWGVTLGPLTGRLLAELVTTRRTPPQLVPLDPLR
jgi:D-amino-acid dehydrogenase